MKTPKLLNTYKGNVGQKLPPSFSWCSPVYPRTTKLERILTRDGNDVEKEWQQLTETPDPAHHPQQKLPPILSDQLHQHNTADPTYTANADNDKDLRLPVFVSLARDDQWMNESHRGEDECHGDHSATSTIAPTWLSGHQRNDQRFLTIFTRRLDSKGREVEYKCHIPPIVTPPILRTRQIISTHFLSTNQWWLSRWLLTAL